MYLSSWGTFHHTNRSSLICSDLSLGCRDPYPSKKAEDGLSKASAINRSPQTAQVKSTIPETCFVSGLRMICDFFPISTITSLGWVTESNAGNRRYNSCRIWAYCRDMNISSASRSVDSIRHRNASRHVLQPEPEEILDKDPNDFDLCRPMR